LNYFETFGSKVTSIFAYPPDGTTPLIGYTFKEDNESKSPLMDSLSKLKAKGTSSKFFRETISLFFPPSRSGPKLIFAISKKMLG